MSLKKTNNQISDDEEETLSVSSIAEESDRDDGEESEGGDGEESDGEESEGVSDSLKEESEQDKEDKEEESENDSSKLFSDSENETDDETESSDEEDDEKKEEYDFKHHWKLIDLFFKKDKFNLVNHHIYSYNNTIDVTIPSTVEKQDGHIFYDKIVGNFRIQHILFFSDLGYKPETMNNDPNNLIYPIDAIDGSRTYISNVIANVLHIKKTINLETNKETVEQIGKIEPDIYIDKILVMVGSKLCATVIKPQPTNPRHDKYDSGGYFIVGGVEKSVATVETNPLRKPTVVIKKNSQDPPYIASIMSRPITDSVGKIHIFKILLDKKTKTITLLLINYFKEKTSVFALLRALGLDTDEKIVCTIVDLNNIKDEQNIFNHLQMIMRETSREILNMNEKEAQEYLIANMDNKIITNLNTLDPEIAKKEKKKYFFKVIDEFILPHENDTKRRSVKENRLYKAICICQLIRKILIYHERIEAGIDTPLISEDRDSIFSKLFEVSGDFISAQFSHNLVKYLKDCYDAIESIEKDNEKSNSKRQINTNVVNHLKLQYEQSWRQAFNNKSNIGVLKKGTSVVQSLTSTNISHWLSFQRKILILGIDANNKSVDIRMPQNSAYGTECPAETPEGAQTGLTRNFAISTQVTINEPDQIDIIKEILFDYFDDDKKDLDNEEDGEEGEEEGEIGKKREKRVLSILEIENITNIYHPKYDRVFLNRQFVGLTTNLIKLKKELVRMKRLNIISRYTSLIIEHSDREFHIFVDGGRAIRPLLVVSKNNELKLKPEMLENCNSWDEFYHKYPGVVEWIEKREEVNILLAATPYALQANKNILLKLYPKSKKEIDKVNKINRYDKTFYRYTHCELHPALILGATSMNTEFIDTNQGPRVCYGFVQVKQAQSAPQRSNYLERIDNGFINYHPQYPLCTTNLSKYGKLNLFPSGENIVLAFKPEEKNQEDNLIINASAIGRALFFREITKKYDERPKRNTEASNIPAFRKPDISKCINRKKGNPNKLEANGFVKPGTKVVNGDYIMGIVSNITPNISNNIDSVINNKTERDNSIIFKGNGLAIVSKNIKSTNPDGNPTGKTRVSLYREPEIGDKFNSRFAQKGTVGEKRDGCEMPFTESGLVPDIIVNPGCIPKRMTIGQLIETTVAKVCAVKGIYSTTSPFTGSINIKYYLKELIKLGMEPNAKETYYNGSTLEKMKTKLYIGIVYYQALKQMTYDKVHARGKGLVQSLTKQPTEGRVNYGGLKFGEMERDVIMAHGATQILKHFLLDYSDGYLCHICKICGVFASRIKHQGDNLNQRYECEPCSNKSNICKVHIPYAFKLASDEFRALGIWLKFFAKKSIRVFDLV